MVDSQPRPVAAVSPPPGATFASFVFFASLAGLLALLYAGSEWWNLAGGFGFPSDAAWGRAVFARNLASGEGLCFNPGTPTAGAAGFSWITVLAGVGFFTGDFVFAAKLLGVLAVILTSYLVWEITSKLLGDWRFAFIAGLVVVASPRLTSAGLGGTEAAWAALLVAATIHWQAVGWEGSKRQRTVGAILAGLAALARPELLLLLPLLAADRWLTSLAQEQPGRRFRGSVLRSIPEFGGALAVIAPFVAYNLRVGGPAWQQPDYALRAPALWDWTAATAQQLWWGNPALCLAAVLGLPAALVAAVRPRAAHPSFLVLFLPLTALLAPGLLWRQAGPGNAIFTAVYLIPLIAILGACGLFFAHRFLRRHLAPQQAGGRQLAFGFAIALGCAAVFAFPVAVHRAAWREHGFQVKKVSDLQGYIGRWSADHLAADASIASREVGAIAFFSHRRMVDLGGTISLDAVRYLSKPGSLDSNLLEYLQKARPSHLAIRPSDFPDLSQRADLLSPAVTCVVTDPISGGVTTMALYETPWPPLSVMEARRQAGRR
jgi:hypothetical protein